MYSEVVFIYNGILQWIVEKKLKQDIRDIDYFDKWQNTS